LTRWGLYSTYLGDQWRVGDLEGMVKAAPDVFKATVPNPKETPQNLKEYDPEWAKAFVTGSVGASCDHAQMLAKVKCPVLFTHHFSQVDEKTGALIGASAVRQVDEVERLVKKAGQPFVRLSFPKMGHYMHREDPELFVRTLVDWEKTLPTEAETRSKGVFAR
jgi:pimeloyl-ACP methyl ester carboxylesterase